MYDLIIRNGSIIDGTGKPPFPADLAVSGDRIVALGRNLDGRAAVTINAGGLAVTPGFIDIHSHSDFTLLLNRRAESSVRQGVTTEVLGNCGMGCAPLRNADDLALICLEYLPAPTLPTWNSFEEWLLLLEGQRPSINVAALVGHGALRMAVMGAADRPASPDELSSMQRLLAESLEAGAIGFSTGLEYSPGTSAPSSEIGALARQVGKSGGYYATHIRSRDYAYSESIQEAVNTAAEASVSLQISHVAPRWGARPGSNESAFEILESAARAGVDVWIDNHPYLFGRGLVTSALPPYAFTGGVSQLRERLRDPEQRAAMHGYPNPQWKHWKMDRWDILTIFDAPHNRDVEGHSIREIADATRRNPWDVVCDLLLDEGASPGSLWWSAPIHEQQDVDISFRSAHGLIMSDGAAVAPYGALQGIRNIYSYGWVAHVLRRYVRERRTLTIEDAVFRMSGLPAQRLGLSNRGVLAPDNKADIVIFDPDSVQDEATVQQPIAYSTGIRHVWVNGVHTIRDGQHTGATAGEILRHRQ